jgi:hypothetical protein
MMKAAQGLLQYPRIQDSPALIRDGHDVPRSRYQKKQENTDRNPLNQNETSDVFESFVFKPAMEMFKIFKTQMESVPESYANIMSVGMQFWGKMMQTMAESAQRSAEG